jgi:hypothetical protein
MNVAANQEFTCRERLEFLHRCHHHMDEQVRYSNQKASYILTTVGAIFVGCGAALMVQTQRHPVDIALLISGLVLCGASAAASCVAIFPIVRHQHGPATRSLMFFGSISRMSVHEYIEAVSELTEGQIEEELARQIHTLSRLAQEKYHWVRISTAILAPSMLLLFAGFIGMFTR